MIILRAPVAVTAIALVLVTGCAGSRTPTSPAPRSARAASAASWLTYHGDAARTGVDSSSPALHSVHRAWTSPALDGAVYAEPLVLGDRVFVATENDSVYALGANTGRVVWRAHLGRAVPQSALPCGDIDPTGITGTPVIDPATGTLYAVAFVQPGRHQLVAIDTSTGHVRFRRNADPKGADPLVHQQRGALVIANRRVYAPYGGLFGDCGDYHGMVIGRALDGSGSLLAYRVPSQRGAGIWAPSGIAADPSGGLLVATGNSSASLRFDYGNAVIRLSPGLKKIDWFAPRNWALLNGSDRDVGSIGPALLRGGLVFQSGKEGVGYLLRLRHLGGKGGAAFTGTVCSGGAYGGTAAASDFVYVPCTDGLVALRVTSGPSFKVAWRAGGFDAGPPILAGGAVWCVDIGSGRLLGFTPHTGHRVFESSVGQVAHFTSPTSAAGRLFVAAERRVMAFAGV